MLRICLLIACAVMLAACIMVPFPTDIQLTGLHVGTVVDASTGQPVEGAVARFKKYTDVSSASDSSGSFRLGPVSQRSNWSGVLLLAPAESMCHDIVSIDAPGYRSEYVEKVLYKPGTGNCKGVVFEYHVKLYRAT